MKIIISLIAALSIIGSMSLSNALGANILYGSAQYGATISVSSDGIIWYTETITQEQLNSAVLDRNTGKMSLILSMEAPSVPKFVKSSGQVIATYIVPSQAGKSPNLGCVEIIVITIIIVAGVMIYQLVKCCMKNLGKNNNHKDDDKD